jgi:protein SCO1
LHLWLIEKNAILRWVTQVHLTNYERLLINLTVKIKTLMSSYSYCLLLIGSISFFASCTHTTDRLPILGEREAIKKNINGKEVIDTLYQTIPDFTFVNQYNDSVTAANFKDKIYVMKRQMLEVYKSIQQQTDVAIISHSIDPRHDTPEVLKKYAEDLGVKGTQWQFVTGDKDKIYDIGQKHYLVTTGQDASAPGGYIHSGAFILIDKQKRIRGMYDGTKTESTKQLIEDIQKLRNEK